MLILKEAVIRSIWQMTHFFIFINHATTSALTILSFKVTVFAGRISYGEILCLVLYIVLFYVSLF